MSGEIFTLISRCSRMFLYSQTALLCLYYVIAHMCESKPKWKMVIILSEIRMMFSILVLEILAYYFSDTRWYEGIHLFYSFVFPISGIVIVYYFFNQKSLTKVLLALISSEMVAAIVTIGAWTIVNSLQDKQEGYPMAPGQMLQKEDLMVMLVMIPLSLFCMSVLQPFFKKFRKHEFKHPTIWNFVIFLYYTVGIADNMFVYAKGAVYAVTGLLLVALGFCIVFAIFFRRKAITEKTVYAQQQKFAETHLSMLQEQFFSVSENREQLKKQICMVEALNDVDESNQKILQDYLKELKDRYEHFIAGVYCDDQMVDALLCHKKQICEQYGITADFYLQEYNRGVIEKQDMIKLLLVMLDFAIQNCMTKSETEERKISLHMSKIKGQLMVELITSGKQKFSTGGTKTFLKKYNGTARQEKTKDGIKVQIMASCH